MPLKDEQEAPKGARGVFIRLWGFRVWGFRVFEVLGFWGLRV